MPQTLMHGRNYGTGKRKNAIARVRLKPGGSGVVTINARTIEDYFPREILRLIVAQPFDVIGKLNEFDVDCTVCGSGITSQAKAVRHGISRALLAVDPAFRPLLKKAGLLTRDARKKERKKPGQPGARKRFQYSKR
jgi:small subunit ribosomal protein S9